MAKKHPGRSWHPFSPLRRFRKKESEIDEELAFHLSMEEKKLRKQGLSTHQARRQARLRFGGQEKWRHEVRDIGGIGPLERLMADLRFGWRVLRRSPVFAIVAILTLALGIGASTAIFSVVDGILLSPLPYAQSDELVTVWADYTKRDGPQREWWGYPNFHDLREATAIAAVSGSELSDSKRYRQSDKSDQERVFEDLATWGGWNPTLTSTATGDPAVQLQGATVSHGMLSRVLRVAPILGSGFTPADDVPNAPLTVILSERLWQSNFGSDPGILGSQITLNGERYAVLGVLPADFRQPLLPRADIWALLQWSDTDHRGGRGSAILRVIGRLAEGATLDSARARSVQVAATLEQTYPEDLTDISVAVFPLKDDVVSTSRAGLLLLLAAVVATLLIVCINLANLLLARGAARQKEFSLRLALGASTSRLVRQLLTESLLLSGLGGGLGIGLSFVLTKLLLSLAPQGTPRVEEVGLDLRVLAFCGAVTLLCGLIFGLLPASQAVKASIASRIGRNQEHSHGKELVGELLVVGQVAAALVLLIGAGLLVQSFVRLTSTDLGFEPSGLVNVNVFAPPARYPEMEQAKQYLDAVQQELSSVPGTTSLARGDTFPLAGFDGDLNYTLEGEEAPKPGEEDIAWFRRTTPGYFSTLGIQLVAGRDFQASDNDQSILVVLINETLAGKEFGDQDPVGKRLNINNPATPKWREIVGVVSDTKNFGLRNPARPSLYTPYAQVASRRAFFALRTDGDTEQLMRAVSQRLASFDPEAAPPVTAADSYVEQARGLDRFVTWLLSLFAAVALLLAAIGLYGVISYRVSRRSREIGLRLALGAQTRTIGTWILGRSLMISLLGVALGLGLAALSTRALRSLLFEVEAIEPWTYALLGAVMVVVACLASSIPAWRATRLDPASVLKAE